MQASGQYATTNDTHDKDNRNASAAAQQHALQTKDPQLPKLIKATHTGTTSWATHMGTQLSAREHTLETTLDDLQPECVFLKNAIAIAVLTQAASQTRAPEHSLLLHNLFTYSSDVHDKNLYVSTYIG